MAIWTDIVNYVDDKILDLDTLNNQIFENLRFLRNKPRYFYQRGFADANYTVTSTTFLNVDGTNMNATLTTYGNDVRVRWGGVFTSAGGTEDLSFELVVDSSPVSNDANLGVATYRNVWVLEHYKSFEFIVPNLAAGSHTFALQWRTSAGTVNWLTKNVIQFEVHEL